MKYIKYSFGILSVFILASCLKAKNDFAGLREDPGTIVTSTMESQYLNTDQHVIGFGWQIFTQFSFTSPATENVRFFSLHISQPRSTKISGSLKVKVTMAALSGFDPFPAGAVTIPAEIDVPASSEASFDFPVKLAVNKSLLDVTKHYGATFTITSVNQGVFSELDKSLEVIVNWDPALNTSKYSCVYKWTSTVEDAANQFAIRNNTKPVFLYETGPNQLELLDWYAAALSAATTYSYLWANNVSTGANTALFKPRYNLDANGKVTSISVLTSGTAGTASNVILDGSTSNQIVYTAHDDRSMNVKYSFDFTSTINGVPTTRKVTVTEKFTYNPIQAMYY
jgi:hypothetical protein